MGKKKTTEQFIEEAIVIHGNKYEYSYVEYKTNKNNVKIWCFECNTYFWQRPDKHLIGHGCSNCNEKKQKTLDEFIRDAVKIHQNKFDYRLVKYQNNKTKVIIKCNNCPNIFEQTPSDHLQGYGCSNCANIQNGINKRKTKERFIDEAIGIHGDKYEYSDVEYITTDIKVKIWCFECSKHFWQTPHMHLQNKGCKRCCLNGHSKKSIRWLKIMQNEYKDIEHAENKEEFRIPGTNFKADGWSPHTKTIFEFLGCYWHGCLCFEDRNEINRVNKMTMQQLYDYTMERERIIKELGYNIISIWECKFDEKYN
jgi:Zn finger protein HypA/HybF involved in hydrogenase expression